MKKSYLLCSVLAVAFLVAVLSCSGVRARKESSRRVSALDTPIVQISAVLSTPTPIETVSPQASPTPSSQRTIQPKVLGVSTERSPEERKSVPSPTPVEVLSPISTSSSVVATIPSPVLSPIVTPVVEPKPSPTPSYEDLHCPKVVKIEDSLGNQSTTGQIHGTFKKGDISSLTFTITATDPQGLPLYYEYGYTHFVDANPIPGYESQNNSFTLDVTKAYVGANRWLAARVNNKDGYGCSGAYYDIPANFYYDVMP